MYDIGHTLLGFTVTKADSIEEINCILYELTHEHSGAQVIHIASDDPENLFCLGFKTHPSSSNGVAHILEHMVLCGSKRFPVKDPFFSMHRRSLATFMNALTGADFTCYPASSLIEADFYNLLDVYLDACFFPKLTKESFLQEGHRLGFEHDELTYKGIVFNEMKGALSSPDARMWNAISEGLLPDLPYAYNSGGDPKEIPSLTHEQLLDFHKAYYHPSRCLFFFYGNLPLEKHLASIEQTVLQYAEKQPPIPPIPKQPRFTSPRAKEIAYPCDDCDLSKKTIITFSWLTTHIENQKDALALAVLDSVLMETDASPLKRALLASELCSQADGFFDSEMSELPYVIVCKGAEKTALEPLKNILFSTLETIARDGIPHSLLEAAIHQIEFQRSEISGDFGPFGLTLFMRSVLLKQHGVAPENGLVIHKLFTELLYKAKDPGYFPALIRKYFLDNPHYLQLTLLPDNTLSAQEQEEEHSKLHAINEKLTEQEKTAIIEQERALETHQREEENLACLPKLTRPDIPENPQLFPLSEDSYPNGTIYHHDCFTNHIAYIDVIYPIADIDEADLPYLQLFISLVAEVGTEAHSFEENLSRINLKTGGISASVSLYQQYREERAKPALCFRGKALDRNTDELIALLKENCRAVRFDETARIKELILQTHTALEQKVHRGSLGFAALMAGSSFSPYAATRNQFSGLPYYSFIKELTASLDRRIDEVCKKLNTMKQRLLTLSQPDILLSSDRDIKQRVETKLMDAFGQQSDQTAALWSGKTTIQPCQSQIKTISSPVAFTAQAFPTVKGTHEEAPYISLATQLAENLILHRRIREEGGAYGAGASYNPSSGMFSFFGFRDPHIKATLSAFRESLETLAAGAFTDADVDEALFSLIQNYDSPVSPESRAHAAYSALRTGRSFEVRKSYRSKLLDAKKSDIMQAVERLLLPAHDKQITIAFCGVALAEKENILPYAPL